MRVKTNSGKQLNDLSWQLIFGKISLITLRIEMYFPSPKKLKLLLSQKNVTSKSKVDLLIERFLFV